MPSPTGLGQAPGHLSGLSVPCPLPSPPAGTLTCELKSCPYCTRALEDLEGELSGSESGDSDGRGIYEFTQDIQHGDRRDPMQPPPATDTPGPGSPRRRAQQMAAPGEPGRLGHLWATFSGKLRRIVDSKYFSRGIMMAILVNTLSMGVEYHEQVRAGLVTGLAPCHACRAWGVSRGFQQPQCLT